MSVSPQPVRPRRLDREQASALRAHLARLVSSNAFSSSRRCCQFLEWIVDRALEGRFEDLRERTIGAEIFGRPIGYDTATDAIVRVKATEVRRRLAQFYQQAGSADGIRIELPPGSYVPEFHTRPAPVPETLAAPPPARRLRLVALLAALALAAIAAGALLLRNRPEAALESFWAPMLHTNRPILVCLGATEYFKLSSEVRHEFAAGGSFTVNPGGIMRLHNAALSAGMLRAVLSVSGFLDRHGKPFQVVWGNEVRFQELRDQNVVLIGAFNNPWTLGLTHNVRFTFERDDLPDGTTRWDIRDRQDRSRVWAAPAIYPQPVSVDYALITRLFDRDRGRLILAAAGINQYGTEVAGDLLKDPVFWKDLSRRAPAGWQGRNLQVVLRTSVADERPVRTEVAASYFW